MKKEGKIKLLQTIFKHQFPNSGIRIQMCWETEPKGSPILKEQGKVEENYC